MAKTLSLMDPHFTATYQAYKAGRLLDLVMPDGRLLRSYTAADCFRYSGWLRGVGNRVRQGWSNGSDQVDDTGTMTVGDTFQGREATLGWHFSWAFRMQYLLCARLRDSIVPGDELDNNKDIDADVDALRDVYREIFVNKK
jgi:hypothetical protein